VKKPLLTEAEQGALAKKLAALPDKPGADALAEIDAEFERLVFDRAEEGDRR
jgi:hypothetical protein